MGALGCADIERMCVECSMVITSLVLDAIYKVTRGQACCVARPHYIKNGAKKNPDNFALLKSDIVFVTNLWQLSRNKLFEARLCY